MLLGLVVGLPVSIVLAWLSFRNADVDDVWSVLRSADASFATLALAPIAAVYVGQAIRWRAIARARSLSAARFSEFVVSSVAVNNVLPGRVGDLLRARWLQVSTPISAGRALASVFVDRAFDVLALVVFLAVSLPFVSSAEWLRRIALSGLVLLIVLGCIVFLARTYTRRRARERRLRRSLVRRVVRDALEGLAEPLGRRRALALAGISVAVWAMWALAAWLVTRAVGIDLSPIEAIFVTAVINLGVAIPSSPGFIGTYQWLGVAALGLFGVGADEALAFAILMHAVWYVPTSVIGGGLLLRRAFPAMSRSSGASNRPDNPADSQHAAAKERTQNS